MLAVGEEGALGFLRSGGSSSNVHCLFICLDGDGYRYAPAGDNLLAFHTRGTSLGYCTATFRSALWATLSLDFICCAKTTTYTSVTRPVLARPKRTGQLNLGVCYNKIPA
jgi:hypothetical protein